MPLFQEKEENFYLTKPKRSSSNSHLLNKEEKTFENYQKRNETQFDLIESPEKRIKTQTFLENTFNTKIAKKLTLENQKSLRERKKLPETKGNCKENSKHNVRKI